MSHSWDDLKFPLWEIPRTEPKRLSMNEYAGFVQFGWEHAVDRYKQLDQRNKTGPKVPFRL